MPQSLPRHYRPRLRIDLRRARCPAALAVLMVLSGTAWAQQDDSCDALSETYKLSALNARAVLAGEQASGELSPDTSCLPLKRVEDVVGNLLERYTMFPADKQGLPACKIFASEIRQANEFTRGIRQSVACPKAP